MYLRPLKTDTHFQGTVIISDSVEILHFKDSAAKWEIMAFATARSGHGIDDSNGL